MSSKGQWHRSVFKGKTKRRPIIKTKVYSNCLVYCSKHSLFGKMFRHSIVKPCFWFCILMSKTRVIVLIPEKWKLPHLCISVSVGVVARHPLYFPYLKKHLTSSVVEEYFSHLIKPGVKNAVTRWAGGEKAVCCESRRGIKIHSGPSFTFASVHHYFKSSVD